MVVAPDRCQVKAPQENRPPCCPSRHPPLACPGSPQPSHAVICVSMKIRMRTRRAGTAAATIIQGGKGRALPRGGMNHVRLWGEVTESPVGTVSFCMAKRRQGLGTLPPHSRNPRSSCPRQAVCPQYQGSGELGYEQVWGKLILHPAKLLYLQGSGVGQRLIYLLPDPQNCQKPAVGSPVILPPTPYLFLQESCLRATHGLRPLRWPPQRDHRAASAPPARPSQCGPSRSLPLH